MLYYCQIQFRTKTIQRPSCSEKNSKKIASFAWQPPLLEKKGLSPILLRSGADLGFSRGGGGADFRKFFQNFDDLFFLGQAN